MRLGIKYVETLKSLLENGVTIPNPSPTATATTLKANSIK